MFPKFKKNAKNFKSLKVKLINAEEKSCRSFTCINNRAILKTYLMR